MNKIHGEPGKGEFHSQIQELKIFPDKFYSYFHMSMDKFFNLLNLLKKKCKSDQAEHQLEKMIKCRGASYCILEVKIISSSIVDCN